MMLMATFGQDGFWALRTCTSDRQGLLKDDRGWQIE
jgi:hypothetical protein